MAMEREILFRGKRTDNGEWIYGDLRHISDGHGGYILCIVDNTNGRNNDVTGVEVVPETVGQYTGLTDKNDVKIFEGDIVTKCRQSLIDNIYCFHFDYGFVEMNNCAFGVRSIIKDGFERFDDEFKKYKVEYKVVGNIYDNPEMLSIKKGNIDND